MLNIILTEEDGAELKAVLEEYLSDLRMEMADTDRADFRDMLRARKAALLGILRALVRESELGEAEAEAREERQSPASHR